MQGGGRVADSRVVVTWLLCISSKKEWSVVSFSCLDLRLGSGLGVGVVLRLGLESGLELGPHLGFGPGSELGARIGSWIGLQ